MYHHSHKNHPKKKKKLILVTSTRVHARNQCYNEIDYIKYPTKVTVTKACHTTTTMVLVIFCTCGHKHSFMSACMRVHRTETTISKQIAISNTVLVMLTPSVCCQPLKSERQCNDDQILLSNTWKDSNANFTITM